jgi:hemerythrin
VSNAGRFRKSSVSEVLSSEHRGLASLYAEVGAALCHTCCAAGAREAFAQLCDELETHFGREEKLYYPAIWALRPERKTLLMGFVRAHEVFRTRLGEIAARLQRDLLEEAAEALDELVPFLAGHQLEEEELLLSLDQELAASPV